MGLQLHILLSLTVLQKNFEVCSPILIFVTVKVSRNLLEKHDTEVHSFKNKLML